MALNLSPAASNATMGIYAKDQIDRYFPGRRRIFARRRYSGPAVSRRAPPNYSAGRLEASHSGQTFPIDWQQGQRAERIQNNAGAAGAKNR